MYTIFLTGSYKGIFVQVLAHAWVHKSEKNPAFSHTYTFRMRSEGNEAAARANTNV